MNGYILETRDVRDSWVCEHARPDKPIEEHRTDFDRWLHDAQAQAWDAGMTEALRAFGIPAERHTEMLNQNPHR